MGSPDIYTICTLRPFLSSTKLLVTPVVALLVDLSILEKLSPCADEVACIYTHPLEAILDPSLTGKEPLVPKGSEDWPYEPDYHVRNSFLHRPVFKFDLAIQSTSDVVVPFLRSTPYRMHRYRTSASPIKGFTSEILVSNLPILQMASV